MNKVVINNCYGGFSLSPRAWKRYYELKYPEKTLYFYNIDFMSKTADKVSIDKLSDWSCISEEDFGDHLDDWERISAINYWEVERHDPILVQVVEELGVIADGQCAELKVVEISGNKYRICEYDGSEWVETPENINWIEI